MKTNKWCSILLMGLMLGACSKDVIEPDNGEHTDWETNKVGYINLSVNLPSQVASRSEAFDDGDVSEWAVKDATLLLFAAGNSNETEADATFIGAYELALNMNVQTPAADALSSTAQIIQKINKLDTENNDVYALVVLNRNGQFTLNGNDVMFGQEAFSGTFKDFSLKLVDNQVTANGFLMTNAPLFATNGSVPSGTVQTLTKIDASSIYPTKEDAAIHSSAQVFVEKAVAKVTMNGQVSGTLSDTNHPLPYTLSGWMLDNTNKRAYLVRQVDNTW